VSLLVPAWAAAAWLLQRHAERAGRARRVGALWVLLDVGFLTALLAVGDGPRSGLGVVYPVLVFASALHFRRSLAYLATVASAAGYVGLLAWAWTWRPSLLPEAGDAAVLLVAIAASGALASEVIRRMRGLAGLAGRR
jgi:hypothetical protein